MGFNVTLEMENRLGVTSFGLNRLSERKIERKTKAKKKRITIEITSA